MPKKQQPRGAQMPPVLYQVNERRKRKVTPASKVIEHLAKHGPAEKREVAKAVGLPTATVVRAIERLEAAGAVRSIGFVPHGRRMLKAGEAEVETQGETPPARGKRVVATRRPAKRGGASAEVLKFIQERGPTTVQEVAQFLSAEGLTTSEEQGRLASWYVWRLKADGVVKEVK